MGRREFGAIIPKPPARQSLAEALACLFPAPICDSSEFTHELRTVRCG